MIAAGLVAKTVLAKSVAFVRGVPWQAWAVAGMVLVGFLYGARRYDAGVLDERTRQEQAQRVAVDAVRKQTARIESKERARLEGVAKKLEKELRDGKAEADSVIAGLRTGNVRLRDRFKCPAKSGLVPEAAGTPAGSNAGTESGLLTADAEFLIRFASDADAVTKQLGACQATLRVFLDRGKSK
jgi:hypothetical protein